jgi:hypothetical protein
MCVPMEGRIRRCSVFEVLDEGSGSWGVPKARNSSLCNP